MSDLDTDISLGAFLVDEEDVTFLVCTCDLVVRLTSSYRHIFKHLLLEKHATSCDGRPETRVARLASIENDAVRFAAPGKRKREAAAA